MNIPKPMTAGEERDNKSRSGFRIFANDTSSGRPWCWYAPDLDTAKRLAEVICDELDQEVEIAEYVGCVRRSKPPIQFFEKKII